MYAQQTPADPSSSEGEEEAGGAKAKRKQSEEHRLAITWRRESYEAVTSPRAAFEIVFKVGSHRLQLICFHGPAVRYFAQAAALINKTLVRWPTDRVVSGGLPTRMDLFVFAGL